MCVSVCRDIWRHCVHICGLSIHVFTCMSVPVTICVSVCVIPQERKWQWGVSRPPGDWQRARSQDRGRARDTSCTCWKPLQTQETGTDPATHTSFTLTVNSSGSLYCISEMGDNLYDVFASVDLSFSIPAVSVPLQSPLHDSGWKRETGQGGVPEEYAQPSGVL